MTRNYFEFEWIKFVLIYENSYHFYKIKEEHAASKNKRGWALEQTGNGTMLTSTNLYIISYNFIEFSVIRSEQIWIFCQIRFEFF